LAEKTRQKERKRTKLSNLGGAPREKKGNCFAKSRKKAGEGKGKK